MSINHTVAHESFVLRLNNHECVCTYLHVYWAHNGPVLAAHRPPALEHIACTRHKSPSRVKRL